MSEVQRYAVIETALCIGGNLHEGEVLMVRADEHDRELAALREELALTSALLDGSNEIYLGLRKSLAAAEQRNSELVELLRMAWGTGDISAVDCRRIDAACTQPTESGASE